MESVTINIECYHSRLCNNMDLVLEEQSETVNVPVPAVLNITILREWDYYSPCDLLLSCILSIVFLVV